MTTPHRSELVTHWQQSIRMLGDERHGEIISDKGVSQRRNRQTQENKNARGQRTSHADPDRIIVVSPRNGKAAQ